MQYLLTALRGILADVINVDTWLIEETIWTLEDIIDQIDNVLIVTMYYTMQIVNTAVLQVVNTYAVTSGVVTTSIGTLSRLRSTNSLYDVGNIEGTLAGYVNLVNALQLKTALNIQYLTGLVNDNYQSVQISIYRRIAVFSATIGMGAGYLPNAFQIARSRSLAVSAAAGKNYSLAEAAWIFEMRSLLVQIQAKPLVYRDEPVRIYNDIDNLISRPAIDAQAVIQASIITRFEGILKSFWVIEEWITTNLDKIDDLEQRIPSIVADLIKPETTTLWNKFTNWINQIYKPDLIEVHSKVSKIDGISEAHQTNLSWLNSTIKNPAKILQSLQDMPLSEALEQEDTIGEIASRKSDRENPVWEEIVEHNLLGIENAIKQTTPIIDIDKLMDGTFPQLNLGYLK